MMSKSNKNSFHLITVIITFFMAFELPKLDYEKTALAPIMSEKTLDLHHGKHHQTYITNLNKFISGSEMAKMSLE